MTVDTEVARAFSKERGINMAENMSVSVEESMVCRYLFCLVGRLGF